MELWPTARRGHAPQAKGGAGGVGASCPDVPARAPCASTHRTAEAPAPAAAAAAPQSQTPLQYTQLVMLFLHQSSANTRDHLSG